MGSSQSARAARTRLRRRKRWRAPPRSTRAPSPRRRWRSPPRFASTRTRTSRSRNCRPYSVPIYLPESTQTSTESLTPRQIVAELDKYVVGQGAAKRAVAIALRNRMRRQKLAPDLAEEIAPKNILMIGPTGVGKTEIARRLARLAQSPFIKVEASKFTEVGYVGRDVESMVRDLVELGVEMIRAERIEEVRVKARQNAEERLLDLLLPPGRPLTPGEEAAGPRDQQSNTREWFREQLRDGRLDGRIVEVDVREKSFPSLEIITGGSVEEVGIN